MRLTRAMVGVLTQYDDADLVQGCQAQRFEWIGRVNGLSRRQSLVEAQGQSPPRLTVQ